LAPRVGAAGVANLITQLSLVSASNFLRWIKTTAIEPTLWFELDQQLHHDELGAANLPSS
jgi:hypothetical protein